MKRLVKYLVVALFIIMQVGCETVVDIELPERDSQLTLNCLFNSSENMKVTVHASKGTLEAGELEVVRNATVTVTGTDGTIETVKTTIFDPKNFAEYYTFSFLPKSGVNYTITASAPGFKNVQSIGSIPEATEIIAVDTATVINKGFEEGQINITFRDPAEKGNSYEFKFYALVYNIDTMDGQFVFEPITQELYAYFSDVNDFFGGDGNELLVTDELFNGREYTQRVNYDFQLPYLESDTFDTAGFEPALFLSAYLITEMRTLSEDYFLFQSTYNKYLFSSGDPFAQPVQVYGNIENGFGIFAGYNSTFDTLQINQGLFPSPLDP